METKSTWQAKFLFSSLISSLYFGFDAIIASISFAAFIYSGSLTNYITLGYDLILIGAAITIIVTSWSSSLPAAIAGPQDYALPSIAIMAAAISSQLASQTSQMLSTTVFAIGITTVITGIFFFFLGKLRLGKLITFIPYPVLGGFLAGTGWLIFIGSFHVITPSVTKMFSAMHDPMILMKWSLALAYAILIYIVNLKNRHALQWPIVIISPLILFYLIILVVGIPITSVQANGFLLTSNQQQSFLNLMQYLATDNIVWPVALQQSLQMGATILLCAIAILLNATGIEVSTKKMLDFDRELHVAGIANIIAGLVGGIVSFTQLTNTIINTDMQHDRAKASRLVGMLAGIFCFIGILLGAQTLGYIPRFLIGGLLMYFGIYFLKKWVFDVFWLLPLIDCLLILIILFTIAIFGLLPGLFLGIIFSLVVFVVSYSNISIMKFIITGDHLPSKKQRDRKTQKFLAQYQNLILYVRLQNYLFFGNAKSLVEEIRHRIATHKDIKYVIYNFQDMSGVDSSVIINFERLKQYAMLYDFKLILTDMNKNIYLLFEKNDLINDTDQVIRYFPHYEMALEWCEDDILDKQQYVTAKNIPLEKFLLEFASNKDVINKYKNYFTKINFAKNTYLLKEGETSRGLYYIESGRLTIQAHLFDNKKVQLRIIGPGNIVGEFSLYYEQTRTASVLADEDCVLQFLSYEKFMSLKNQDPEFITMFNEYIIKILRERVVFANQQLAILSQ